VQEIVDVEAKDVVSTSAGPRARVWDSKGKAYRETPTTKDILAMAETVADLQGPETPLVDHSTRWVQRHLDDVTGELAEDDEMWAHVTPHDLRRTWATLLSADIEDPLLIMDFGGWEDIETFLEHYRGSYSPAVQRRELSKVDWLDVGDRAVGEREPALSILEQSADESGPSHT
jgi:integrase